LLPSDETPLETQSHSAPLSEPGSVIGTIGYMAPEQVLGKSVDQRSDIFAFGVILFEMLTGHRPFRAASAVETLNAILKDDPPQLSVLNPSIPVPLERIVRHSLEKNAEERFQTARDIAFSL